MLNSIKTKTKIFFPFQKNAFSTLILPEKIWPIKKTNTILNVCPQGHKIVIERFGKLNSIQDSGLFLAIPLVDKLKFVVDMREITIEIDPQKTITKDNVQVNVSGNIFIKFNDAERACYGSVNPIYSVKQHVQAAMRAAIGKMDLDELLHNRNQLNLDIQNALQKAAFDWGMDVKRYELTDISPDKHISESMDEQSCAERKRRAEVLKAEGIKKSKILQAEGEADSIIIQAKATSDSINIIAKTLENTNCSEDAVKIKIAEQYIKMYSEIGKESNTFFFNQNPSDINALLAQAASVINATKTEKNCSKKTYRSISSGSRGAKI